MRENWSGLHPTLQQSPYPCRKRSLITAPENEAVRQVQLERALVVLSPITCSGLSRLPSTETPENPEPPRPSLPLQARRPRPQEAVAHSPFLPRLPIAAQHTLALPAPCPAPVAFVLTPAGASGLRAFTSSPSRRAAPRQEALSRKNTEMVPNDTLSIVPPGLRRLSTSHPSLPTLSPFGVSSPALRAFRLQARVPTAALSTGHPPRDVPAGPLSW